MVWEEINQRIIKDNRDWYVAMNGNLSIYKIKKNRMDQIDKLKMEIDQEIKINETLKFGSLSRNVITGVGLSMDASKRKESLRKKEWRLNKKIKE
jgi:hypothetical protein